MVGANRIRRRFPLNEISTIDHDREVDPRSVGVRPAAVDRIWKAVEGLYLTGVEPAITLCIRRRGEIIINRSIGHTAGNGPTDTDNDDLVVATPETPFCIFSASKAVTAMVMHHLDDKGVLHVDDRVSEYIPEFAVNGKQRVTIRHVLTHRAGIAMIDGNDHGVEILHDWDGIVKLLCEASPTHAPGRRLAYHAITGGFILGEIVKRVTGKTIRQVLAEEVLDPLGFKWMNYGCTAEQVPEIARSYFTGSAPPWPLSTIVARALGVSIQEAAELSGSVPYLTSIVPSGNVIATANEASRFFQILLNGGELDGKRVFAKRTIHRAINETAYLEMDLTLGFPVRYGHGLMLGSEYFSIFGPFTPRAYGHLGFMNMYAFADPQRDISVGLMTSGKPFASRHLIELAKVLWAISSGCPRR